MNIKNTKLPLITFFGLRLLQLSNQKKKKNRLKYDKHECQIHQNDIALMSCLERRNEQNKIIFFKDIKYTYIPHILAVLQKRINIITMKKEIE